MNYWLLFTYYCNYTTPYLNLNNNLCYSSCPLRTVANNVTLRCKSCPFDCLSCQVNGRCLSCDSVNDFRQLEEGYCVPIPGYYESNAQAASPCIMKGCSDCTANLCFACLSGYYKRGNTCFLIQDEVDTARQSGTTSVTLLFVGITLGLIVAYLFMILYLKCRKPKHDDEDSEVDET